MYAKYAFVKLPSSVYSLVLYLVAVIQIMSSVQSFAFAYRKGKVIIANFKFFSLCSLLTYCYHVCHPCQAPTSLYVNSI